jgi:hypothetical protein
VESRQHFPSVQKIIDMLDLRRLVTGDGNYESQNALLSGQGLKSAPSILDLVISHRNFGASDPRDKIYGLLSLALRNEPVFKGLIPDYTIPVVELFVTFAYSAIRASNSLAILSHCRGQSLEDIPSWIPDWSHNRNGQLLGGRVATTEDGNGDRIDSDTDHGATENTYRPREDDTLTNYRGGNNGAQSKEPLYISLDKSHGLLSVEGILWDRIELIHVPFVQDVETIWENGTHFMVAVGQCKKMALDDFSGPNPYFTKEKQIESFWYALFRGDYPRKREGVDMDCKQWLPPISKDWDLSNPE